MIDRRIIGLALAALLIFGLLTSLGFGAYRIGWSQGYLSGNIVAGSDNSESSPQPPQPIYGYGYGHRLGHNPFFLAIGLFFKCGLFLLLFLMTAKFLRFGLWRMAGGPGGKSWAKHKHHWKSHWEHSEPGEAARDAEDKRSDMI